MVTLSCFLQKMGRLIVKFFLLENPKKCPGERLISPSTDSVEFLYDWHECGSEGLRLNVERSLDLLLRSKVLSLLIKEETMLLIHNFLGV